MTRRKSLLIQGLNKTRACRLLFHTVRSPLASLKHPDFFLLDHPYPHIPSIDEIRLDVHELFKRASGEGPDIGTNSNN